jgi:Uma2 family endonuclease
VTTVEEIQQVIRKLSRFQREGLAEWILNLADFGEPAVAYAEPDVAVVCGTQDPDSYFMSGPRLIFEVLSPSTERTDRREKALNYRNIPSLEEYVLVAQRPFEVTLLRRSENWLPVVLNSLEAMAEFRSISLSMTLEQIYEAAR